MASTFSPPAATGQPWPADLGVIDTMVGLPQDPAALYRQIRSSLRDRESRDDFVMPASYMFHDVPASHLPDDEDPVGLVLGELDRHGIETALISMSAHPQAAERALTEHPDRFVASWSCDPNQGMDGIRALVRAHEQFGVRAVSLFPHGVSPQVAIDAPQMYPIYAKCVELGIPVFVTVGIAGPRVPSMVQRVELIDQVMYDFPELVFVMRHGAEPWTELAVKLMLKWPNLYYSTSGFSPRYYPTAVLDYANTRGADKILYGGYFPMGLSLDRIMTEMRQVPLKDDVWPKFLRENAARVLGLTGRP
ncbi:amidohydrolase 2 [Pseudofrankia inefficax]|uniref:Amidohydrolase 2 n=2 Tax=Pseudofrankia inefficax (strain DSM 45817 / CECT 9037 / DDB 130130 / EuI1c) TaxID=298654 RepID=E3J2P8_PSEI1|nr:amidohydrolase family protein [Pseudofrankia inefficax]ADP80562.1 amidohydrolase 2 [Pseudofrankia inefficax]